MKRNEIDLSRTSDLEIDLHRLDLNGSPPIHVDQAMYRRSHLNRSPHVLAETTFSSVALFTFSYQKIQSTCHFNSFLFGATNVYDFSLSKF